MSAPSSPTASEPGPTLSVSGLGVAYGGRVVLQDVSMEVWPGTLLAVVGPNGAGKSSLLRGILGLAPVLSGEVRVCGVKGRRALREVIHVPQRGEVEWDFPLTVEDVVRQGRWASRGLFGRLGREDARRVDEALERTGLEDLRARGIAELSGGQQQRMFLARALAQEGSLLLLDEPFAGVDAASEGVLLGVLQELRDAGRAVVVVHHDLSTVGRVFDRAVLLSSGRVVASGEVHEVLASGPLTEAYGERLVALGRLAAGEGA